MEIVGRQVKGIGRQMFVVGEVGREVLGIWDNRESRVMFREKKRKDSVFVGFQSYLEVIQERVGIQRDFTVLFVVLSGFKMII